MCLIGATVQLITKPGKEAGLCLGNHRASSLLRTGSRKHKHLTLQASCKLPFVVVVRPLNGCSNRLGSHGGSSGRRANIVYPSLTTLENDPTKKRSIASAPLSAEALLQCVLFILWSKAARSRSVWSLAEDFYPGTDVWQLSRPAAQRRRKFWALSSRQIIGISRFGPWLGGSAPHHPWLDLREGLRAVPRATRVRALRPGPSTRAQRAPR